MHEELRRICGEERLYQLPFDQFNHHGNPSRIFHRCPYLVARISPSGNLIEVARFQYQDDARIMAINSPLKKKIYVFHLAYPGIIARFALNKNFLYFHNI